MESRYCDNEKILNRLFDWYDVHGKLLVAFDFDETVYDYDRKGDTFKRVHEVLKECKRRKFPLILFTCRNTESMEIDFAKDYCKVNGFMPDYINFSPANPTSQKPLYNILLDDRAGLGQALECMEKFLELTKQ